MKKYRGYWYQKYRDLKLAEKMIIIYVLMLGICFLISITALQVSFNIYDGKLYEKSLQELDFFTQEVNRSLDQVEAVSYNMTMDLKIQEQLSKMKTLKHFTADYSYEVYQLRMLFNNELTNSNMISNMLYTDGDTTQFVVGIATGTIPGELYDSVMNQFHEAKGAYVIQQPTKDYPYLLTGRDIRKHIDASLEYLGSLLITCDVSGMIEKNIDDLEAESSALCVYSDEGVIYENQENMMERLPRLEGDSGFQIIKERGQRYFVCHLKSSKTGWTYVNVFPYSEIYGQNQNLRYLMFGGFLLLFLVSALILKKLAHMIVKPLEHLTESMQIVETGDFDRAREFLGTSTQKDEIGLMAQEFRVTLDKIDNLIHENYEKQILLKDTKYKMLQAQINPHFLYNTLNSINWMIRARKNDEAAEMTVALGTILRSALNKQQYVTLEEELDSLKKYMTIQEYRYRKRVVFSVECEASGRYLIPHMTLQPLVENSIYHGVEKMLTPCAISVVIKEDEERIVISVSDNGPGMTKEELEAVRSFTAEPKGHGIGIKNIYERLRMAFEQEADFHINSACGKGTAVTIRIPKTEVMKNDD
ncbi:HAMP domain-containing protein [Clostridium sp. MCC353]|uniref:sensor histidine kinase n=1 Tax=Clostridium sp. MCC353 TaxID=2592646 RepID=UPI001C0165C6|nr:sensor histidine kinase [Clostridium sp. MCC353]MBT9778991.1 HAMP domain-containing protein [Clostridium sp. MCC353]